MSAPTLTSEDYRWAALVVEEHALEEDDSDLLYVARKLFAEHERLDALDAAEARDREATK